MQNVSDTWTVVLEISRCLQIISLPKLRPSNSSGRARILSNKSVRRTFLKQLFWMYSPAAMARKDLGLSECIPTFWQPEVASAPDRPELSSLEMRRNAAQFIKGEREVSKLQYQEPLLLLAAMLSSETAGSSGKKADTLACLCTVGVEGDQGHLH